MNLPLDIVIEAVGNFHIRTNLVEKDLALNSSHGKECCNWGRQLGGVKCYHVVYFTQGLRTVMFLGRFTAYTTV